MKKYIYLGVIIAFVSLLVIFGKIYSEQLEKDKLLAEEQRIDNLKIEEQNKIEQFVESNEEVIIKDIIFVDKVLILEDYSGEMYEIDGRKLQNGDKFLYKTKWVSEFGKGSKFVVSDDAKTKFILESQYKDVYFFTSLSESRLNELYPTDKWLSFNPYPESESKEKEYNYINISDLLPFSDYSNIYLFNRINSKAISSFAIVHKKAISFFDLVFSDGDASLLEVDLNLDISNEQVIDVEVAGKTSDRISILTESGNVYQLGAFRAHNITDPFTTLFIGDGFTFKNVKSEINNIKPKMIESSEHFELISTDDSLYLYGLETYRVDEDFIGDSIDVSFREIFYDGESVKVKDIRCGFYDTCFVETDDKLLFMSKSIDFYKPEGSGKFELVEPNYRSEYIKVSDIDFSLSFKVYGKLLKMNNDTSFYLSYWDGTYPITGVLEMPTFDDYVEVRKDIFSNDISIEEAERMFEAISAKLDNGNVVKK